MAVTALAQGTQTATVTTEHTLADTSASGTYLLQVDLSGMLTGDVVELRVYEMVLTAGTRRVSEFARYTDAQPTDNLIAKSIPISTNLSDSGAIRFTLEQAAGTSRNFAWCVLKFS